MFFVINKRADIWLARALSIPIETQFRSLGVLSSHFFNENTSHAFLKEVEAWGPVHSIFIFDLSTLLNEVDRFHLKNQLKIYMFANSYIHELVASLY